LPSRDPILIDHPPPLETGDQACSCASRRHGQRAVIQDHRL